MLLVKTKHMFCQYSLERSAEHSLAILTIFGRMQDWFAFLCWKRNEIGVGIFARRLDRLWWQQFPLFFPPGRLQSVGSRALSMEDKSTSSRSSPDLIQKREKMEKGKKKDTYSGFNLMTAKSNSLMSSSIKTNGKYFTPNLLVAKPISSKQTHPTNDFGA